MSKALKVGKPRKNRGNVLKKLKVLKKNEEIISRLKKQ